MAKDKICLDYDECYASESNFNSDEPELKDQDEANYLVFGYNIQTNSESEESHVFSIEDQNDNIMMGGILSLNRESTSFIQQLYIQNENHMERQFGHYFNLRNGYLAIGDAVDELFDLLDIGMIYNYFLFEPTKMSAMQIYNIKHSESGDLTWIPYFLQEISSMYQVELKQIEVDNVMQSEIVYDGEGNGDLNILTFDTAISGIAMNEIWQDEFLTFIQNVSDVALIFNRGYPYYCINTDYDNVLDDIYNKLPHIKISLSADSNMVYEFIISPEQYVIEINNDTIDYRFCLDISFDWDGGVGLGSLAMNNYVIIYSEDEQSIAIYDTNLNHLRQQNNNNPFDLSEENQKYIFILS